MHNSPLPCAVRGETAMVATGHPLAAQAAAGALAQGGSAVDAAIAADAVMGVVEPMATGIGGDLLAMLVPPGAEPQSYNGSGRSPMAFEAGLLAPFPGARLPERHVHTLTVPGAVRGWHDLHQRHGRLPWRGLFAPAIAAARDGFAVGAVAAREWALFEAFVQRPGALLSKSQLEERLYAFGAEIESNTIEVYISRLRKKLGRELIETVRGMGYRLMSA